MTKMNQSLNLGKPVRIPIQQVISKVNIGKPMRVLVKKKINIGKPVRIPACK